MSGVGAPGPHAGAIRATDVLGRQKGEATTMSSVRHPRLGPALLMASCAAVCAFAGCRARQRTAAGEAYRKELRAHQGRFQRFQERYPDVERRLAEARDKAPAQVAGIVDRKLVPLLDGLVRSYSSVVRSGRTYVALLPSSVDAREALRRQLDGFEEQRRLMEQIRGTYQEEATLFRQGRPERAALEEVFERRAAAVRKMQDGAER